MNRKVLLTEDGLKKLHEELSVLKDERRKEVIERIQEAISHGDLSENADYAQAKEEQAFIEGRIQEVEEMIKNAEIIAHDGNATHVSIGSTVTLKTSGREVTYTIVGSNEANPSAGKISNESLVGMSLIGARPGQVVSVQTPVGNTDYEVVTIK
ncbi:MAG: transcription elongation factor GreA [Candidatus Doudnabacteria bacterium]|nr:transcription elongation factor GreA [Candidatus Doudnabacteria bacterium]